MERRRGSGSKNKSYLSGKRCGCDRGRSVLSRIGFIVGVADVQNKLIRSVVRAELVDRSADVRSVVNTESSIPRGENVGVESASKILESVVPFESGCLRVIRSERR